MNLKYTYAPIARV